jgi:hypothetical protein
LEHGDEYAFVSHGDDLSASLRLGRAPDPESLSPTLRERRNRESPLSMEPRRGLRAVILIAGLALCQAVLYGESLLGQKILLPLDLLARHNYYLPAGHDLAGTPSHNPGLSDRLLQYEPERRFAASELRAGRVPQWNPYGFAGAPLGSLTTYSPFNLIYYLFPHPVALAWLEFCVALAAGLGTHLFFRRVIGVGFWPAAIGAWVFPLSGFFALWQGFSMLHAVAWLPWVLLGTDAAVRNPKGWGGPGLALASACAMSGGQLAMQVLLASGLFGVWRTIEQYGWRLRPPVFRVVAVLTVAWAAGVMLATPDWLHLRDYSHASARMIDRADGLEDRPPVGLSAIPQVVLPDIFGSYQTGHFRIVEGNRLESSAAAYVGLLAVLVLVPIGLADRRRRGMNGMWLGLTLLSLAWVIDLPGLVSAMRLPGLNIISHNRSVFIASFSLLAIAVVGLDRLRRGAFRPRIWCLIPVLLLLGASLYCGYRVLNLPELVETHQLVFNVEHERLGLPDSKTVALVQDNYRENMMRGLVLCLIGLALWGWLERSPAAAATVPLLGALMVVELLWFGRGLNPQTDPALYFPRVPVLTAIERAPPGRILCVGCLPPRLAESHGLRDIRGYDGLDPLRLVELMEIARDEEVKTRASSYARLQWFVPKITLSASGSHILSPVLDMLNVRYLILRRFPFTRVPFLFKHDDYWVLENREALPRVYVPERVESRDSDDEILQALAEPDFDPARVAYVNEPLQLPDPMRGEALLDDEVPSRVAVTARMETPGLVVLADLWFEGWKAELNGEPVPILRTNYALRGVAVPAGESALVFSYEPAGFATGVRLMTLALLVLGSWTLVSIRRARRSTPA